MDGHLLQPSSSTCCCWRVSEVIFLLPHPANLLLNLILILKVDKSAYRIRKALERPGSYPFQACQDDFSRREWSKLAGECHPPDEQRSFPQIFTFCDVLILILCNRWPMRKCQAIWQVPSDCSNSNPRPIHSSARSLIRLQSDTFRKQAGTPLKTLHKFSVY